MIRTLHAALMAFALGLIGLVSASPAEARNNRIGLVEIENTSGETRRVCVYKPKRINLKAERCFDIPAGRMSVWSRGENRKNERFNVKVFECCKLIPKFLYSREGLEGDTVRITVAQGRRFGYSRYRKPVPKRAEYRVRFCNVSQTEPVWLMIAMTAKQTAITEGYWTIARGECRTVNYSERVQRVLGGNRGIPVTPMYRAFTTGDNRQTWGGTEANEDPLLCVNTKRKFVIDHWRDRFADGGAMYACDGADERQVRFRWGPTLDEEVQTGRVNF